MNRSLRCQCGAIDYTDEDDSLPYDEPGVIPWVDKPCAPKPIAGLAARELARLAAENDALRRENDRLKGRLARVLRYSRGYFGHMGTGVWSSRRTGGKR